MNYDDIGIEEVLARVLQTCPQSRPVSFQASVARLKSKPTAWKAAGILGTTRVETQQGLVPAQLVRVGNMLRTRKKDFVRVLRISNFKVDQAYLDVRPEAAPVIIKKHSLSRNHPMQDVGLSPAQVVSIGPNRFEEEPVEARELSSIRGRVDRSLGVLLYVQFHLEKEAVINCDGVWALSAAE
jgi:hypothetical protein